MYIIICIIVQTGGDTLAGSRGCLDSRDLSPGPGKHNLPTNVIPAKIA